MNYLGLDYGTSHLGVALATGPLAEPLTTLSTPQAITALKDLIQKYHVDGLVIGEVEDAFLQKLSQLDLPIYEVDETLTTIDAQKLLLHTSQSRRRDKEHAVAAALLLQSWLDTQLSLPSESA